MVRGHNTKWSSDIPAAVEKQQSGPWANRVLLDADLDGLAKDLPRPSASFYRRAISTLTTPALWRGLRRRSYSSAVVIAEWRLERAREGAEMEPTEIQARATIAAALIVTRAVEVPAIPTSGDWSRDTAALRLRDLTDYVYQMITTPQPR